MHKSDFCNNGILQEVFCIQYMEMANKLKTGYFEDQGIHRKCKKY